jgi:hypothetical protein
MSRAPSRRIDGAGPLASATGGRLERGSYSWTHLGWAGRERLPAGEETVIFTTPQGPRRPRVQRTLPSDAVSQLLSLGYLPFSSPSGETPAAGKGESARRSLAAGEVGSIMLTRFSAAVAGFLFLAACREEAPPRISEAGSCEQKGAARSLLAIEPEQCRVGEVFRRQPNGQAELLVVGTGLTRGDAILWNGHSLKTNFASSRVLSVDVPAALLRVARRGRCDDRGHPRSDAFEAPRAFRRPAAAVRARCSTRLGSEGVS